MSATVLAHDDDDDDHPSSSSSFLDYFACFHGHSFFNIIYLAL